MTSPFPTTEVFEGRARLLVPDLPRRKGPLAKGPWPFYNPTMTVNRDVSAVLLAHWPGPLAEVLDGLAATGAWGIRMALEARAAGLVFNDRSGGAVDLIRENVRRNGVAAEVLHGDLRPLLESRVFDFVDIDPFGPPTPFLDAAVGTARIPRGLGITATDTAPLSGTYPEACVRRYGAKSMRCAQGHEIGLRILLGYCARLAAVHGRAIRPVLSFSAEHFLRTHVLVLAGGAASPTDVGHVRRDEPGGFVRTTDADDTAIGPLWLGPLSDPDVLRGLAPSDWTGFAAARLLDVLRAEAEMPPFFVTTDELARQSRGSPPRMTRFLDALREGGFRATRTHFDPRGVKTDAPLAEVLRRFEGTMPSGPMDG